MIAAIECLACGHENKRGAASCAVCSTSLNVKLCAECEAVNALTAENCHDCGAPLVAGASARAAPVRDVPLLERAEAFERVLEEAPRTSVLAFHSHSSAPTRTWRFASLWIASVAFAAGAGYYFSNRVSVPAAVPAPVAAAVQPQARTEPIAPAAQARPEPAPAPPPKPIANSASAKPAKRAVAQPSPAPKLAAAPVTHTHAAFTGTATAATAVPAAVTTEPPVSEPAAAPAYARVTHTKASQALEKPMEPVLQKPLNNQPAGCAPGVAALGLCPAK